ncbi:hypothetical protein [Sinisalibacter lacisalsi]|uniref:Uncharacterized protein n=1 Tax=Sinisalibacter lacisalsi TaxID=1526570 RepID=A0ABQ1QN36_9RHOB|nr:hypothetical protein [Sinisalibacter lacisalsi]GGD32540.1 hypothetical protein GCM10011358_15830 [Sinisalibacter lacisalsi]
MIGLVLWFNPKARVGMIWCEDQGPLAFLGPEVELPGGCETLDCGDQLTFSIEVRDEVRFVRDVASVTSGLVAADPRDIIAGFHSTRETESHLNIVA